MKSQVLFSKQQRLAILLLIAMVIALQCVYFFMSTASEDLTVNTVAYHRFQKEMDALRAIEIEKRKPKVYPFNPNYMTDYKGASLGMSNEEIDKLLAFREQNKWINSVAQFQQVTGVSDSLLNQISVYFKFPEWVKNTNKKQSFLSQKNDISKPFVQKRDLNTATAIELQSIHGIGVHYSERIVKFRNRFLGGFIADIQLQDVSGLTPELIAKITKEFTVKTPRAVQKIDLNTATKHELVTIQHIDYNLAHRILEYRQLHQGFQALDELGKVKDFPINKIDIIKLYLSLD
ncbi:ComEA family DNA-binding protein [Mariniflexile ostreae]|uniref:ComEA family DNA-binding protein n=1 Tax=Mariniflexile ostreae TaxID=1520892 RepID=A0ABV5F783_9FLAO